MGALLSLEEIVQYCQYQAEHRQGVADSARLSQAGIAGGQTGIRAIHQAAKAHSERDVREQSPVRGHGFPVDCSPASPTVTSRTTGKVAQGPCAPPASTCWGSFSGLASRAAAETRVRAMLRERLRVCWRIYSVRPPGGAVSFVLLMKS